MNLPKFYANLMTKLLGKHLLTEFTLKPIIKRVEQITFCQCTNFRVHEDVCSAQSCTRKLCTHVVIVHWSRNISKEAPLPGCIQIQIRTNPQCVMSIIATFNSLFFKAILCKSVQYWVPVFKLHASFWESSLHALLFWLWQGHFRAVSKMSRMPEPTENYT